MKINILSKSATHPFKAPGRYLAALVLLLAAALLAAQARAGGCPDILRHTFGSLQTGEPQDLCRYRGQVVLVVNTASYCGYTDQWRSSGRCWTPARSWCGRPDPGADP